MKKELMLMIMGIFLLAGAAMVSAGEKAPQNVIDIANSKLVNLGTDPLIVNAVKAENKKGKTLSEIKEMDKKWRATPGIDDYMQALMSSECAKLLRKAQETVPYYAEIFVMDNQGANVAMTDKTSDYWQGDEDKFKKSFNDGTGGIHISEVKFDDSSQAYLVQVSVPVKDGDKVIGAVTIGLDLDKME